MADNSPRQADKQSREVYEGLKEALKEHRGEWWGLEHDPDGDYLTFTIGNQVHKYRAVEGYPRNLASAEKHETIAEVSEGCGRDVCYRDCTGECRNGTGKTLGEDSNEVLSVNINIDVSEKSLRELETLLERREISRMRARGI